MISKPLFKQSCKANAGIWTFVTTITCFMLAIIIFVLGNLNVNEIRSSMTDMFVKDAIESTVQGQSMTYFNLANNSLSNYKTNDEKLKYLLTVQLDDTTKQNTIAGYNAYITGGMTNEQARQSLTNGKDEATTQAINTLIDYYLVQGENYSDSKISEYVLNQIADAIYNQILDENDEETANNAKTFITKSVNDYVESVNNSGNDDVTEFSTLYIPTVLKDVFYEQSFERDGDIISISDYFSKDELNDLSYNAILSFRAKMDIKQKQIIQQHPDWSETQINQELTAYSNTIISDISKSLAEELPEKVANSLTEIGNLDVYGLVIGSIFFRIAGLLLPMIFVIMASNNLISGQVDSGSMAYVLSTPTKRRTVTITQMCYLVSAIFATFFLTSLTSVVCLAIVNSAEISITIGQILLLNLGAFITMFAISGICFLSSAWFNRSKMSMSCGGGLTMFFLVATILGLFGSNVIPSAIRIDAMKYFNYVSLITLFDAISILSGTLTFLWKFAILIGIGIISYFIAIKKFDKKDLPL